jgi:putative Mg2+ transporter-C (MgtC) family protein
VPTEAALLARIALGFGLAFVIGFERELRGSPAGDRTFALVGGASTAIAAAVWKTSPQALAGVVTGIGFIGAGVVVHGQNEFIRGITTASAIFATAGIGVVVGTGHLALGSVTALGVLLVLEIRNVPVLRRLDARRYQTRFRDDNDPPGPLRGRRG